MSHADVPCSTCGALGCDAATCRQRRLREHRAARRHAHERLVEHAHRLREAAATGDERTSPVAVVPHNTNALAPLPEERRRAFEAHLAAVVEAGYGRHVAGLAREAVDADAEPSPDTATVLAAGCATCAGSCCRKGGIRAFLSADTLHRYFDAHPAARPRDALRAYLAPLGRAATYERSCVYHERTGCALPRALRADTCNRYFCGALAELRRGVEPLPHARAFVAAADDGAIHAAAFVDARALRVVPVPHRPAS